MSSLGNETVLVRDTLPRIFLYVSPAVEQVLPVDFEIKYGVSSPINGIFLYVAPAVEHALAVAFGKKLFWF